MAILQVNDISKNFAGDLLFRDISFAVDERDKIGLIGVNGAGKTTLIKILLGLEDDDIDLETKKKGNISKKTGLKIGYLSQNTNLNPKNTVFDELMEVFKDLQEDYQRIQVLNKKLATEVENFDAVMKELSEVSSRYESREGYTIEYKVKQVLNGLSLIESVWNNKVEDLSGGQVSRVALGKILLEEPELLILDEPTNHLDLMAIEWLERFLKDYKKAFVLISHDILFLDNVTNRIFEMEGKTLNFYSGNYTDYKIQKEAYLVGAVKSFEKEQDKIRKMEEYIRKYKAGIKTKQARGREKILNRMEKMDNPVIPVRKIRLKFRIHNSSADRVLRIENLSKSYEDLKLFSNLNLDVYKGDRIGVIGKNGAGKSTLLKIINGFETSDTGNIIVGERVKVGYYDQNHSSLDLRNTVLEEIMESAPLTYEEARTYAGGFLFTAEDVDKKVSLLSGGEKARVEFMKLILSKPNFLIFDEPTNHLDIYSREILEEALEDYEGTLIVVSHDRYFLEATVNSIYEITSDGATLFKGDYDAYISRKEEKIKDTTKALSYEEQKKSSNRIKNLERKIMKLEEDMEKIEAEKSQKEKEYELAGKINDLDKLLKIQEELDEFEMELLNIIEQWEESEKELDSLKNTI
ncbi:MAG: ABC-F family ATP-binding cassette domain-containing protein [Fusobacteriaceae bacterium]